MGYKEN